MPTEDETTTITHSTAIDSTSVLHPSCPPEEQIQAHAPREERLDGIVRDSSPGPSGVDVDDRHETTQHSSPDTDAQAGAEDSTRRDKRDVSEDATEYSSTIGSPETPSDSDGKLARSMATAALGRGSPRASEEGPRYLSYPSSIGRQKVCIPTYSTSVYMDRIGN